MVYYVVRYRRRVTRENLAHAYPELAEKERRRIERAYYRHISDLLVEAVQNLYASPKAIVKRYRFVNTEVVNRYYEQGRSVVLMSSHYNNWEYMITSLNFEIRHHAVGVGKPLQDRGARYITRRRGRFGTQIVDQTDVRQTMEYYHRHGVPVAYMMLSDQSPSNARKSFWTMFMHQETPFLYGAEYFARKYDMPVLYYEVRKVRRGHYEVRFSELCGNPAEVPQYTIVSRYVDSLERTIAAKPEYWLWSHKRWKRHRPSDVPLYDYHEIIRPTVGHTPQSLRDSSPNLGEQPVTLQPGLSAVDLPGTASAHSSPKLGEVVRRTGGVCKGESGKDDTHAGKGRMTTKHQPLQTS